MEFAAHDLGEAGAALTDALIFAPADQAELLAHIHRYDPNYELTGTAAQLDRHGIRALGEALLQAQRDYLGANSFECGSDYDHQLYTDAQWAVGQNDGFTILSQDTIREQFERFHREYQANGGTLSFDDWVSEGLPQDDGDLQESSETSPNLPPAKTNLRPPARRHYIINVNQSTLKKNKNSVIEPRVNVNAILDAIKNGLAEITGEFIFINNRTYSHHDGILFPVSGDRFHQLDRAEFQAIGVYNTSGNTTRANEILDSIGTDSKSRIAALRAWETAQ